MKIQRASAVTARRKFMTRGCGVFAACLTAPLWNLLGGCASEGETPATGPLKVTVAKLPLDRRMRFEHDGKAVEVLRTESGVTARSLQCTHQGCIVRWVENEQIYFCPCHDGKFNAEGNPVYGPPRESLRDIPVTLTPTEAIIGG
jgi:Rieske Fe-S protein